MPWWGSGSLVEDTNLGLDALNGVKRNNFTLPVTPSAKGQREPFSPEISPERKSESVGVGVWLSQEYVELLDSPPRMLRGAQRGAQGQGNGCHGLQMEGNKGTGILLTALQTQSGGSPCLLLSAAGSQAPSVLHISHPAHPHLWLVLCAPRGHCIPAFLDARESDWEETHRAKH